MSDASSQHDHDFNAASSRAVQGLFLPAVLSALAIQSALMAQLWGHWPAFGAGLGAILFCGVFNGTPMAWLHRRLGADRAEVARSALNTCCIGLFGHLTGWPLQAWLFLPFLALAQEGFDDFQTHSRLISSILLIDAAGVLDGAPGVLPAELTLLAAITYALTYARAKVIRGLYLETRAQRDQLDLSNREIRLFTETALRREVELRQAQKLESVGRLAAGIAHEINNPIQFMSDSMTFVQHAFDDHAELLAFCRQALHTAASPDLVQQLEGLEARMDIDELNERIPKALVRSLDGLGRVAALVRSMKEFARPDQCEKLPADLNHALESTLIIARNEYKCVAEAVTDFGELPAVECHLNELNQVFLNLIINAAHAISDAVKGTDRRGSIRVSTRAEARHVVIAIADDGPGIPSEIRDRIFDPFFTTKEVGRGAGQGLAIARSVVVDKHCGEITFETEVGKGTVFRVRLPIEDARPKREAA